MVRELTLIIFNIELTHLSSEASKWYISNMYMYMYTSINNKIKRDFIFNLLFYENIKVLLYIKTYDAKWYKYSTIS